MNHHTTDTILQEQPSDEYFHSYSAISEFEIGTDEKTVKDKSDDKKESYDSTPQGFETDSTSQSTDRIFTETESASQTQNEIQENLIHSEDQIDREKFYGQEQSENQFPLKFPHLPSPQPEAYSTNE
jgi:hypothetical protein